MVELFYFAKVTLDWANGKCLLVTQFKNKDWVLRIPDAAHSINIQHNL